MTAQEKAIMYAKNYPTINSQAGLFGPVAVSNLSGFNGRVIINLAMKTARSAPKNACISFPAQWSNASRFRPGDLVNVFVEDGYVRKIWPAKPTALATAKAIMDAPAETVQDDPTSETSDPNKPF